MIDTLLHWIDQAGIFVWPLMAIALTLDTVIVLRLASLFKPGMSALVRQHLAQEHHEDQYELPPATLVERDLTRGLELIRILTAAAPLVGLLGTVGGVSQALGGSQAHIVDGIAAALTTTQFGLVIAVPGLLVHAVLVRRVEFLMNQHQQAQANRERVRATGSLFCYC